MELVAKALAGGVLIFAVGLLSRREQSALAAVLIQVPIITVFGFWAAGEGMSKLAGASLLALPLLATFTASAYLLSRGGLQPALAIVLSLLLWLLAAAIWLLVFRDKL